MHFTLIIKRLSLQIRLLMNLLLEFQPKSAGYARFRWHWRFRGLLLCFKLEVKALSLRVRRAFNLLECFFRRRFLNLIISLLFLINARHELSISNFEEGPRSQFQLRNVHLNFSRSPLRRGFWGR